MVVGITGGTGFIGYHLANRFVEDGVKVRILTRRPELVRMLWPKSDAEPWEGDLTEPETLEGFVCDTRVVYHLAGETRDAHSFDMVNVTGTENLLKVCRDQEVTRFVHLSSVGVMGATGTGLVDESTPCNPKSLYEKSKYAGEKLALDAFERFRIPVTVLRPTIVFGEKPNRGPDSLGSWLNAIQKGWFRFFGSGDSVANYIYVGDVVNACLLLAENEKAIGEVYIVSDPCSLRDFVGVAAEFLDVQMPGIFPTWLGYTAAIAFEAVGKLARFSPPLTVSRVRALRNQLLYSSEKIRKRLGFTPVFGWRNGLFRTVEWYKRNKLL